MDNKGEPWELAHVMNSSDDFYVNRIDIDVDRLISLLNKHNLHFESISC